jgi:1-deoxy-D-xylulose-5-phosphate reductoisomerase
VARFHPEVVSLASADRVAALRERLRALRLTREPEILWGREGLVAAATHPRAQTVVSAIVGVVGLEASFKAVAAGKTLALANKEVLVAAGELVTAAAAVSGTEILPVDSEHNAVHQCLRAGQVKEMRRLILTGPAGRSCAGRAPLERATPRQALQHPNWRMGNRITVD